MQDRISDIMASGMPGALQLTWIAMQQHAEGPLYLGTIAEIGQARDISRQAAHQQVQALIRWGAVEKAGKALRLTPDNVTEPSEESSSGLQRQATLDDVKHSLTSSSPALHPDSPSSPSFEVPPFSHTLIPPPKSSPNTPCESGDEKSSPPERLQGAGWIGWLPPGHDALRQPLPEDHPARSPYHPGDWRYDFAEAALQRFQDLDLLGSPTERKLQRDGRPSFLRDWADHFRLMEEQDGYDRNEIRYAMGWLFRGDNFWIRKEALCSVPPLRDRLKSGDRTKLDKIFSDAKNDDSYDGPDTTTQRRNGDGADTGYHADLQRIDDELDAALRRDRERQDQSSMEAAGVR